MVRGGKACALGPWEPFARHIGRDQSEPLPLGLAGLSKQAGPETNGVMWIQTTREKQKKTPKQLQYKVKLVTLQPLQGH